MDSLEAWPLQDEFLQHNNKNNYYSQQGQLSLPSLWGRLNE